jgi:hypothetical protein
MSQILSCNNNIKNVISCLLVAEQNNEFFFMKNHQSHPTSSKQFPEMNETFVQKIRKN